MASVASQLIEEVIAHAQSDSLEDAREYAQTVLTFRITYVYVDLCGLNMHSVFSVTFNNVYFQHVKAVFCMLHLLF